jgi:hypothetical protein
MASYRLRRVEHIVDYLVPIFDNNLLLTSKFYSYNLFKQAALILSDNTLTTAQKDSQLTVLKAQSQNMPDNYISPA